MSEVERELNADLMKESHEFGLHLDSNVIVMDGGGEDNEVNAAMPQSRHRKTPACP